MNGLCQQCQVYYPMPDDFASGTAYACPQCQTLLVPFDPDAPSSAPGGGRQGGGWGSMMDDAAAARDEITKITSLGGMLGSPPIGPPPPKPGDQVQVLWFHPHASPEVSSAREAAGMPPLTNGALRAAADADAETTAPETPQATGADGDVAAATAPAPATAATSTGAATAGSEAGEAGEKPETTFVMRGAGAGVAREELPLEPVRRPAAPAAAEPPKPRTFEPVPRFRQVTTAAPVRVRRGRPYLWAGIVVVAVLGVGAFFLTRSKTSTAKTPPATPVAGAPVANGASAPGATGTAATAGAEGTAGTPGAGAAAAAPTAAPSPAVKTPAGKPAAAPAHVAEAHAAEAHPPAAPAPTKTHAATPPHHVALAHPAPTAPPKPAPHTPAAKHAQKPAPAAVARHAKATPPPKKPPKKVASQVATHAPAPTPAPKPVPAKKAPAPKPEVAAAPAKGRGTSMSHVQDGNLLFRQGRLDQAIKEFEKALLLDDHNGLAHRGLGVAYAKLGRAEAAAREYELYLKLMPHAPDAAQVRKIVDAYYAQKKQQGGDGP